MSFLIVVNFHDTYSIRNSANGDGHTFAFAIQHSSTTTVATSQMEQVPQLFSGLIDWSLTALSAQ